MSNLDEPGLSRIGRRRCTLPLLQQHMPIEEWPSADRLAWTRALEPGEFLCKPGRAAHLAKATQGIRAGAYGRFLSFLKFRSAFVADQAVAAAITTEHLVDYLHTCRLHLRASVIYQNLQDLMLFAKCVAPEVDWFWMTKVSGIPAARERRASRKLIVLPATIPLVLAAYLTCDSANDGRTPLQAATRYRDGLMILMLAYHSLRVKNLAELRLGVSFIDFDDCFQIVLEETVKNKQVVDTKINRRLASYIRVYIEKYRAALLGSETDNGWLWISRRHAPMAQEAISSRVIKVSARLGYGMTPQRFRHAATTRMLGIDPTDLDTPACALAHRGVSSVNRTYDRSGTAASQAYYARLIDETILSP